MPYTLRGTEFALNGCFPLLLTSTCKYQLVKPILADCRIISDQALVLAQTMIELRVCVHIDNWGSCMELCSRV